VANAFGGRADFCFHLPSASFLTRALRRRTPLLAMSAKDVVYAAETCICVGACTGSSRLPLSVASSEHSWAEPSQDCWISAGQVTLSPRRTNARGANSNDVPRRRPRQTLVAGKRQVTHFIATLLPAGTRCALRRIPGRRRSAVKGSRSSAAEARRVARHDLVGATAFSSLAPPRWAVRARA
jgi:hypothetical protein